MLETLHISVPDAGLHDITPQVMKSIAAADDFKMGDAQCTLFIRHTSASLLIQENYDPSARVDLQNFFNRLVPEGDSLYTHTLEGPDDMPAHIKAALTASSLSIPVLDGRLLLGTWQGVFLWEHRRRGGQREVLLQLR